MSHYVISVYGQPRNDQIHSKPPTCNHNPRSKPWAPTLTSNPTRAQAVHSVLIEEGPAEAAAVSSDDEHDGPGGCTPASAGPRRGYVAYAEIAELIDLVASRTAAAEARLSEHQKTLSLPVGSSRHSLASLQVIPYLTQHRTLGVGYRFQPAGEAGLFKFVSGAACFAPAFWLFCCVM